MHLWINFFKDTEKANGYVAHLRIYFFFDIYTEKGDGCVAHLRIYFCLDTDKADDYAVYLRRSFVQNMSDPLPNIKEIQILYRT